MTQALKNQLSVQTQARHRIPISEAAKRDIKRASLVLATARTVGDLDDARYFLEKAYGLSIRKNLKGKKV